MEKDIYIKDTYTDIKNPIFNVIIDHYKNSNTSSRLPRVNITNPPPSHRLSQHNLKRTRHTMTPEHTKTPPAAETHNTKTEVRIKQKQCTK
jgi:hypothetical protein